MDCVEWGSGGSSVGSRHCRRRGVGVRIGRRGARESSLSGKSFEPEKTKKSVAEL